MKAKDLNREAGKEMTDRNQNLGRILKQRRLTIPLTLRKLAAASGISSSHLGRIERGERFPSASVLQKLAGPLGFEENELFSLAGYLSSLSVSIEKKTADDRGRQLDTYVRAILSQEPVAVQRIAIGILSLLKSIAQTMREEER